MYELLESTVCVDDITVDTYGVKSESLAIEDITLDKEEMIQFIARLNESNASELHLYDHIEDFLDR